MKVVLDSSGVKLLIAASDTAASAEGAMKEVRKALWESVQSVSVAGRPFSVARRPRTPELPSLQPRVLEAES